MKKKCNNHVCANASCVAIISTVDVQRCSKCKLVTYCGRSCQKLDWKMHKPNCQVKTKARAAQEQRAAASLSKMKTKTTANGTAAGVETSDNGEEEECAICLDVLVDPLAPCVEQPSHRYCRGCVEKLREQKLPSCPLCRGKMDDAELMYYEAYKLACIQALRTQIPHKRELFFRKAFPVLQRLLRVDPKHVSALVMLSNMYRSGEGVHQDLQRAVVLLRNAAEQGDPFPQRILAGMYLNGEGVEQDFKQKHGFGRQQCKGMPRGKTVWLHYTNLVMEYSRMISRPLNGGRRQQIKGAQQHIVFLGTTASRPVITTQQLSVTEQD
jgi:hypothetical protein